MAEKHIMNKILYTREGRITIPRDVRKLLNLEYGDEFEVSTINSNTLELRVIRDRCEICGKQDKVVKVADINICRGCLKKIRDGEVIGDISDDQI